MTNKQQLLLTEDADVGCEEAAIAQGSLNPLRLGWSFSRDPRKNRLKLVKAFSFMCCTEVVFLIWSKQCCQKKNFINKV